MNNKKRALLVISLLLVAQLACRSPLPGQSGADSQSPRQIYTLTSLPPFPTATPMPVATKTLVATETPLPSPTAVEPTPTGVVTETPPGPTPTPTAVR